MMTPPSRSDAAGSPLLPYCIASLGAGHRIGRGVLRMAFPLQLLPVLPIHPADAATGVFLKHCSDQDTRERRLFS